MPISLAERIQRAYPRIYLACHVQHVRARTTAERLSGHDSTVLAHLDPESPVTAGELADHLGIGKSTLSATIARLERLGYLRRSASSRDRRAHDLRLTDTGARAMAATSVLDPERIQFLLSRLTPMERQRAVAALELLAGAAAATIAHFRKDD